MPSPQTVRRARSRGWLSARVIVLAIVAGLRPIGRPVDEIAGGMDGRAREYPDMPEWITDQLLTAEQGLRAVTVDAAYALGDETRRGHLAPGTLGDITILPGDIASATPDEIRALDVVATIVNGVVVYCSAAEVCGAG